jgi:hypothetical protein
VDSFCGSSIYSPTDRLPWSQGPNAIPPYEAEGLVGPFFCAAPTGEVGLCARRSNWVVSPFFENYQCADLANDPANCGGWGYDGFACPAGQTCAHGVCSGTPPECGIGQIGRYCNPDAGPGYVCCPGIGCTDTTSDPANCGACGVICGTATTCVAGTCQ